MMRRLVHALAAIAVFAIVVAVPGGPVHAAPGDPACSMREWRNPLKFADCSGRLAAAAQQRVECIQAPVPSSPESGLAGMFTSRPDADLRPGVKGLYTRYGLAGYRTELYDMSCLGITHVDATLANMFASAGFSTATAIVGAANAAREAAYQPESAWGWSDGMVKSVTEGAYKYVFSTLGVLSIAAVGVWLLWRARRGNLSEAANATGWALLVLVVVTAVSSWPTWSTHALDKTATTGLAAMHAVVGPGAQDIPSGLCDANDRADCADRRTVAGRASDTLTESVLYENWLRAVLGSADSETARMYGPALYDASTYTWAEAHQIEQDPAQRKVINDRKAGQWIAIAGQIKVDDPEAYEYLRGNRGVDRAGMSLVAVIAALITASFDLAASFIAFLGFAIIRFGVMAAPFVGTIAVLYPWAGGFKWLMNAVLAGIINIVVFGFGAGLYLAVVSVLLGSPMPVWIQLLLVLVSAVVCWVILKPIKKVMLQVGWKRDTGGGWFTRAAGYGDRIAEQLGGLQARWRDFESAVERNDTRAAVAALRPARPESVSRSAS